MLLPSGHVRWYNNNNNTCKGVTNTKATGVTRNSSHTHRADRDKSCVVYYTHSDNTSENNHDNVDVQGT